MPRFSVVIPTYNRSRWVAQAVASVLAQDYHDFELIVVDDGSDDDTREQLVRFEGEITYIQQANHGVAHARNTGIEASTGEYVGFLDSDDLWEPDTLSSVSREFDACPDAGLVSIMAREIAADGSHSDLIYGKRSPGPDYSTAGLLLQDAGGCSWFFVRRALLVQVGGYDGSLASAEECDLVLRLSFKTKLRGLARPLLLRRKHADNLSNDQAENARCWLRILEKLRREHPEFVAEHPRAYHRSLAKEQLRLGRERLMAASSDPSATADARHWIARSLRTHPFYRRGLTYLAWAWFAPRSYAGWRQRELRHRQKGRSQLG